MTRSGGNMLGVGGTRRNLGREALRGGGRNGRLGGGGDAQAQKQELLRRFQQKQDERQGEGTTDESS
ncbi:DUF6243 family protein [Streptomyces viridochromogenes]|uniref:DUF6243 family protein n=1 Tax=Streptomyces viridochromogenes TaxID=1938 RepID=UPI000A4F7D13|nr:DUF6243 family protein [Streptomyces viridochromogenes]